MKDLDKQLIWEAYKELINEEDEPFRKLGDVPDAEKGPLVRALADRARALGDRISTISSTISIEELVGISIKQTVKTLANTLAEAGYEGDHNQMMNAIREISRKLYDNSLELDSKFRLPTDELNRTASEMLDRAVDIFRNRGSEAISRGEINNTLVEVWEWAASAASNPAVQVQPDFSPEDEGEINTADEDDDDDDDTGGTPITTTTQPPTGGAPVLAGG